ncbi:hypothetical protein FACS189440_06830 [Bacteroidia bacterium]|nr:hypothetical protein FACS189440_06830 [Bacteroidia bacterium]
MKHLSFILIFIGALCATPTQAQSVKGPVRNATFTAKPTEGKNGYEVRITMKYRFQLCAGDVTLDCKRTAHEPLAYWVGGKRYTEAEIKGGCKFKTDKSDLYPNLDFTADVINEFNGRKVGSGKWVWVNLADWGGCLGDYGTGGFKYPTAGISGNVQDYIKGIIPMLLLKNITPKDAPNRDYEIEKCISGKEEPKKEEKPAFDCVEISGVCWATKNLGDDDALYTYDEAVKNCPDGWRLPTKSEFDALIASGKSRNENNGAEHFAGGKLILPAAGYNGTGEQFKNVYAYYWTGTKANNDGVYCFLGYYGNCREGRRGDFKFSVRLVKK